MSLEWTPFDNLSVQEPVTEFDNLSVRAENGRLVLQLQADYDRALAAVVKWRSLHASSTRTMTWAIGALLFLLCIEFIVIMGLWSALRAAQVCQ